MSARVQKVLEMEAENEENLNSVETQSSEESSAENEDSTEEFQSELELPGWSIVTFEGVAMSGLSYDEARQRLEKLNEQKISGLCIVTDEAAARISK